MMRRLISRAVGVALVAVLSWAPAAAEACAACYGKSDSKLAEGMNWGIFSLLFVVVGVLGGIGGFFIFLARKAASMDSTQKV